jgi:hypothetical protein
MKRLTAFLASPLALAGVLAGLALWLTGCSTTAEQENKAERPWNAPQGWEGGIPPSLYDRERH